MKQPLTKKEKIYAIALGLGFMMDKREKGDEIMMMKGLKMLRYLVDDEDRKELHDLADRGAIMEEIDFKKFCVEDEGYAQKMAEYMHEIPKLQRYAVIAIGMAKLLRAGGSAEYMTKPHKRLLKSMLTDEDVKWCQEFLRDGLKKCGCDNCMMRLKVIEKTEELNAKGDGTVCIDELEKMMEEISEFDLKQAKTEETETEDPWKAFGA